MPLPSQYNDTYSVTGAINLKPSTHVDIAPTVLKFTGLPENEWPVFLDGRDLSADWTNHTGQHPTNSTEIINIEYWGAAVLEGALTNPNVTRNTYKTIRIVGSDYGYLYSHWCTNETEIYDTQVSTLLSLSTSQTLNVL